MARTEEHMSSETRINNAVEAFIRIGLIALLIFWILKIIGPFATPVIWGVVIAVACYPPYSWLSRKLGSRDGLAATLFCLLGLALLVVPVIWLTAAAVDGVQIVATDLQDGSIEIPDPPAKVAEWPFVGERVFNLWSKANTNLMAVLEQASDPLKAVGFWLLGAIAQAGAGVLMLTFSIIISAVLLANADSGATFAEKLAQRLAPGHGRKFVGSAKKTVRGVATGVLGVAIIQTVLLTLGFVVAGIPGAAILSFICLVLCVVQLPPAIVVVPAIFYMFLSDQYSTLAAVLFTLWMLPAGSADTFLKPIMLGRGSDAPMLVIFIGAIGGFILSGIIGLFTGAVVMVLGYELFMAWINETDTASKDEPVAFTPSHSGS